MWRLGLLVLGGCYIQAGLGLGDSAATGTITAGFIAHVGERVGVHGGGGAAGGSYSQDAGKHGGVFGFPIDVGADVKILGAGANELVGVVGGMFLQGSHVRLTNSDTETPAAAFRGLAAVGYRRNILRHEAANADGPERIAGAFTASVGAELWYSKPDGGESSTRVGPAFSLMLESRPWIFAEQLEEK
ncbi:MAG TPA: hypothetical protein VGM90_29805 [Kofleriaceae bacterium]|jgi:hypothetical protein